MLKMLKGYVRKVSSAGVLINVGCKISMPMINSD